jgi:hypothetical protein
MAKPKKCITEPHNYGSDFLLLTLKEKRGVLRNAKNLLKLQKEDEKSGNKKKK